MDIIFCSGMMRSASTWSYNVCRIIYLQIAKQSNIPMIQGYLDSADIDEFLKKNIEETGIAVIKTHTPSETTI